MMAFKTCFRWGTVCLGALLTLSLVAGCGSEGDIISPAFTVNPFSSPTNSEEIVLSGLVDDDGDMRLEISPSGVAIPLAPNPDNPNDPYPAAANWAFRLLAPDQTSPLPEGVYSISLSAVDSNQNSRTLKFSLKVDRTPPQIVATGPLPVQTDSAIYVVFDEAMAEATVLASFRIFAADEQPVAGVVSYDPSENKAQFLAAAPLSADATYTARLAAEAITDLAGNPLSGDSSWSFTVTAPAP